MLLVAFRGWQLERRRRKATSSIAAARSVFEMMVCRAELVGPLPTEFVEKTRASLQRLHDGAASATTTDELATLEADAESYSQLRAYLCPVQEIESEGNLAINLMAEWGVPPSIVASLRQELNSICRQSQISAAVL